VNVLAVAHRAGNSLAGLHAANELGADVIECDVHEYRGRLEVRHLKTAGPLPFLWDRWELASASAPRLGLAELLEAGRHGTTLMLDIKGPRVRAARSVAALLHEVGYDQDVLVCGRNWSSVDVLAERIGVRPVLSARNKAELGRLERRLGDGDRPDGVSVHRSLLDRDTVQRLRRGAELVMSWPINDLAWLDRIVDVGVTGVISDSPAVLVELLGRGGREAN
jgi:glycerophosphoryl diester phosphodiesterase